MNSKSAGVGFQDTAGNAVNDLMHVIFFLYHTAKMAGVWALGAIISYDEL